MDKKEIVLENIKGFLKLGATPNIQDYVPTGHFELDFAISNGVSPTNIEDVSSNKKPCGIPMGKLVEIFGEEGGGKSSLAYRIVGYAQKKGYTCAWIDTEFSFSESLAEINGVDRDALYYADMSNSEDADKVFFAENVFDAIVEMCRKGIKVIVLDSVANLVPKARMEKDADQATIGIVAKLMSENLGKILNYASKYGVLVIFINQLREKIGVMFGDPSTTPGGRSLKHNASLRLQVMKINSKDAEILKEEDDGSKTLIGKKSRIYIKKNRFGKPYLEGIEIPIYYEPYFPDIEEIMFDTARQLKLISVRKGVFKWDEVEAEGKKAFVNKIKEDSLQEALFNQIKKEAEKEKVILPPELTTWANDNIKNDVEQGDNDNEKSSNEVKATRGRKRKDSESVG